MDTLNLQYHYPGFPVGRFPGSPSIFCLRVRLKSMGASGETTGPCIKRGACRGGRGPMTYAKRPSDLQLQRSSNTHCQLPGSLHCQRSSNLQRQRPSNPQCYNPVIFNVNGPAIENASNLPDEEYYACNIEQSTNLLNAIIHYLYRSSRRQRLDPLHRASTTEMA